MKDPIEKIKAALREAGAVHHVGTSRKNDWYFPDGEVFVFERKSDNPSIDARVASRKLNQVLARRNGSSGQQKTNGFYQGELYELPKQPEAVVVVVPEVPVVLETSKPLSMKERWELAVKQAEDQVEKFKADLAMSLQRVEMLSAMIPYLDDHAFVDILRSVLPVEPISVPPPMQPIAPPPPPPQHIRHCLQVTRELVYVATQTFTSNFTVNDVVRRMLNGTEVDKQEWQRIRLSVASAMIQFGEQGKLVKEKQGIGKQQSLWSLPKQSSFIKAEVEHSCSV